MINNICTLGIVVVRESGCRTCVDNHISYEKIQNNSVYRPQSHLFNATFRCATGFNDYSNAPDGYMPIDGWYFDRNRVLTSPNNYWCLAANRYCAGVISLSLCEEAFTAVKEGVYSCMKMSSSMEIETIRLGIYFYNRSKLFQLKSRFNVISLHSLSTHRPSIIN